MSPEYSNDVVTLHRKLSPKHLKFIEYISAGFSQADAYRRAFKPKPTLGAWEVGIRASRIASNPLIQERLRELQGKSDRETLLSFNQRLAILAGIAKSKVTKQGDRVRAVEVYSKLAGDQAPERQEITVQNAPGEPFAITSRVATKAEKIAALAAQRKARNQPAP
jgi:chorismate mutase